jgi:conjugal transfer pilus assembly protein TraV
MLRKILLILLITFLSGCAHLNSEFDCPMKPGISCESLDKVNARIDRGEIGNDESCSNISISPPSYLTASNIKNSRHPLRFSETVMRVWVAPFEDTSGNYHQESEIFTVVKPGAWIGYPVKELKVED